MESEKCWIVLPSTFSLSYLWNADKIGWERKYWVLHRRAKEETSLGPSETRLQLLRIH